MAATVYGLGTFAVTDESSNGFYAADLSSTFSVEEAYAKNHEGEDIGVALYNETAEVTCGGVLVMANTTNQDLAAELNLSTDAESMWGTDSGVTELYVTSIELTRANQEFYTGSVTAAGRPAITIPPPP